MLQGDRERLGQGAGEVGTKLDKRIELATVEREGLDIGERFPLKRIVAGDLQVPDAVARRTQGSI